MKRELRYSLISFCEVLEAVYARHFANEVRLMATPVSHSVHPIGFFRSEIKRPDETPRQGKEGAPDVWLKVSPRFAKGVQDIAVGQEIIVITWLHEAERNTLKVHPRGEISAPLGGVFSTVSR